MRIGGFLDISTIDYRDNVSFVIFFAGCNMKCPYCHNYTLIPLDSGDEMTIEEIEEELKSSLDFLDAIVLSGGEPTIQSEGVKAVCLLARKYGLKIKIQTNGSNPQFLKELIEEGLLDSVALDFKATPEKYHLVGGKAPLEALEILRQSGCDFEIHTTLDWDIVTKDDLKIIGTYIPKECREWIRQEMREVS